MLFFSSIVCLLAVATATPVVRRQAESSGAQAEIAAISAVAAGLTSLNGKLLVHTKTEVID